jgi:hypothetical protein
MSSRERHIIAKGDEKWGLRFTRDLKAWLS